MYYPHIYTGNWLGALFELESVQIIDWEHYLSYKLYKNWLGTLLEL